MKRDGNKSMLALTAIIYPWQLEPIELFFNLPFQS